MLVVTLVFAWAGEAGAVFTAAVVTVSGADVADMVWVGAVLELGCAVFSVAVVVIVESDGFAWAIFIAVVVVVAVEAEDAEVGFGVDVARLDKLATGVEITVVGVDVAGGRAGACGQSFAAVVVVTVFAVVVTAGVTLTGSDTRVVAVVIVVAGANIGTALTGMVGSAVGVAATGAVVVESVPVAFTVVQVEGFVSTGAVGATSVCFESGRVDERVLAGGSGVVVVEVPLTGTLVDEHAEETWVDAVSELGTAA